VRVPVGSAINSSTEMTIFGSYPDGAGTTLLLWKLGASGSIVPFQNSDLQNANTRQITLAGIYLVEP